jgi:hypothetical protein
VQNGSGVHIDMNPLNKNIKRWRPGVHIDMNPGLEPTIVGKKSKPLATSPVWGMVVFLRSRHHQIYFKWRIAGDRQLFICH